MDQRPFKAFSTTSAVAPTGIGPEEGKDKTHCGFIGWGQNSKGFSLVQLVQPMYPFFPLTLFYTVNPVLSTITRLGVSIAQVEEGAPTEMARTAAANAHSLDLFASRSSGGPQVEGDHLGHSGNEQRWDTAAMKRRTASRFTWSYTLGHILVRLTISPRFLVIMLS